VPINGTEVLTESMIAAVREWNSEARQQSRHQIRVIVVDACESDVHAEKLSQCVDFTIGHHGPVDDNKAITFSERLYGCIFVGISLQRSFTKSAALSRGYRILAKRDPRKNSLGPVRIPGAAIDADQSQAGSKRACNSDNFEAASASKVPRTQGGGHGPFATAMLDVKLGFFAEGVALRDAIESVSRAVQSSASGRAPTVLGSPDALPYFCINPRRGAARGSGGAGGGTDSGKRKMREADEALLAALRETGLEKDVDWLVGSVSQARFSKLGLASSV
jgi:hypothetical protein